MFDMADLAATYIIDSGVYQLCGTGCSVTNLGKRPAVDSDPDNLEGYAAVFAANNQGNPENIFTVEYDEVSAGGMNFAMMNLHYSSQFTYNFDSQPWNGYATLEEFYNSYEDTDLRKGQANTEEGPSPVRGNFLVGPQWDVSGKVRLQDDGTTASGIDPDGIPFTLRAEINELFPEAWREAGARNVKFEIEVGGQPNMSNDMPIFRYSDILLMRAEALWRMDAGSTEALDLVNQEKK